METEKITQALLEAVRLLEGQRTKRESKLKTPDRDRETALNVFEYVGHAIRNHLTAVQGIDILDIMKLSELIIKTFESGHKVLICGNGGSAADAQHIAAEFVVKFSKPRVALPAIALNTDTSIITATGNDFSFNEIFSRQIEALGNEDDMLIAISTSGKSPNIINAMTTAAGRNMLVVGISGQNGFDESKDFFDFQFKVKSNTTARIQEAYMLFLHMVCDLVDKHFIKE
ncbi:MAG: SIS domain-containing protein [Sphingobacteriia bacterium]|nr:SIS domain-containing protein [Sphingobacteriia bacterium]